MAINSGPVVVGVFREHSLAEQAYNELSSAGWQREQVTVLRRHHEGLLAPLKQAFGENHENIDELHKLDIPDDQQQVYQREFDAGATLMAVQSQGHPLECRDILHRYGAYSVFMSVEPGQEHVIPLRKEEVHVRKQWVTTGEIRVHKRVITEQRTFTIPVTREEVFIERLSGNADPATSPRSTEQEEGDRVVREDGETQERAAIHSEEETEDALPEGGTIRILVHEDEVVFDRRPVVVEEIVIRKKVQSNTVQMVEPVKHEEFSISQSGNARIVQQDAEDTQRLEQR
ncbi:YsnF/AvaK domain-containing protein [Dictyobacter aurantiacus]|uniref:DUF2382 domain-containing protein n=1 Tax=Dictyobacter aurantiacus TaxID=1936993 RepID=A0A401ZKH6_9CHLR|nr:YsnF/AvaK domain-containing protein [Dictyobacter aurantiacus]GCE07356.1 hypothetical protein KDAU_46850 [Dictyobacter aurantiacus]